MGSRNNYVFLCIMLAWPSSTMDLDSLDPTYLNEDRWMYRNAKRPVYEEGPCLQINPSNRDIIKRFHAILPFFDKDHSNTEFLHKFRASVYAMSEGEDLLDREAAFYAVALTPLVFLQNYRDAWCLLHRFHRALRLYQISHPSEKRSALKLLQNFRAVNHKVVNFVWELPGLSSPRTTTEELDFDVEELQNKKDINYIKELIKNLG
ncbi:uncharacterized protein LOC125072435 [Vanessa atalanta]|uniref:uncharacterized protein LOC125072435 n=1 Tax=Vanessa atalanta TaxID=42275 RepID=UPI001FCD8A47|nr:uncharacterized protein LOC125072435 [Vanessa atalanta]